MVFIFYFLYAYFILLSISFPAFLSDLLQTETVLGDAFNLEHQKTKIQFRFL